MPAGFERKPGIYLERPAVGIAEVEVGRIAPCPRNDPVSLVPPPDSGGSLDIQVAEGVSQRGGKRMARERV